MKAFILNYSAILDIGFVQGVLNSTQSIETWASPFPFSAIVISKLTVTELSAVLHSYFGDTWFLITEANQQNTNGWMTNELWSYINNPQTKSSFINRGLLNSSPLTNKSSGI